MSNLGKKLPGISIAENWHWATTTNKFKKLWKLRYLDTPLVYLL